MWLNASTDYAIRMLICLSRASGAVSSSKLARTIGVSPRYLLQIGARLRDAGFVYVGYGPAGGYQLSRPPAKISLMDVIMAVNRKENVSVLPDKRRSKEDFHILELHIDNWKKGYKGSWRALRFQICHRQSEELSKIDSPSFNLYRCLSHIIIL